MRLLRQRQQQQQQQQQDVKHSAVDQLVMQHQLSAPAPGLPALPCTTLQQLQLGRRLGAGATGRVHVGTWAGTTAAIKRMPCIGWEPAAGFLWEAKVYIERLQPLQGACVPQLLGYGYISDTCEFFMALSVVRGTPLHVLRRPLPLEVRTAAAESLRQVHAQGVLHGDVRLDHMVLLAPEAAAGSEQQQQQQQQQQAMRVVILDFDHARIAFSPGRLRTEEQLLQALLTA